MRQLLYLLWRALFASFDDGLFTIAKGAAYSALLSFFPILATAATVLVQMRADFVRRNVVSFLSQVLPPGTEEVVLQQFHFRGQRPIALLVVAVILSLWAASSVIKSLIDGFNAAYRVPRNRSMLAHSAIGMMLAILSLVPLLGATSLILFGGAIEAAVLKLIKVDPDLNPFAGGWELLWRVVRYLVAFASDIQPDGDSIFLRTIQETALGPRLARRHARHHSLVAGHGGLWMVRPQHHELQRAVWKRRDQHRAADLDVHAGCDRPVRLRIQRGIRTAQPERAAIGGQSSVVCRSVG